MPHVGAVGQTDLHLESLTTDHNRRHNSRSLADPAAGIFDDAIADALACTPLGGLPQLEADILVFSLLDNLKLVSM